MIYPHNFEQKIGFDQIREILKSKCLSTLGKDRIDEMDFMTDFDEISEQLFQTEEFLRIIREKANFPDQYFFDVRQSLKRVRIEGMYLDESEIFDLRRSLDTINQIVNFLKAIPEDCQEEKPAYPHLNKLAGDVFVFPSLVKAIDVIIDKYGKMKDNASPELMRIRKELLSTTSGISRSLNRILRAAQSEGVVDKDAAPTLRDGRLVIPVAPSLKRRIKGIVHDESASGKTVFIEPAEVVEANNRIRELEGEERKEIIRILTEFSTKLRPYIEEILSSYVFLAEIDYIRSKAHLANDMDAIKPSLINEPIISWGAAIHPLLAKALQKQGKKAVPLDIELNAKQRILLISGPNAGGKSVCLKTVGLLQYMLQSGMLIALHESSKTGIFKSILMDIGDEQSLEDDLSTYSSHLTNMKAMVKNGDKESLLLIDEFGSGTEPQIGGAIAEALLKQFNLLGTYGVITTHYQNLKHFAEDHEGIVNGAMLYDRHHMQALFRLEIGNPGSSFAVEIARKIGLPENIIADASDLVGAEYINADKYLLDIVRDKQYWERKRRNIRQQEKQMEDALEKYTADIAKLQKEKKEIIRQSKQEAESLLSETNARIENTIRTIKEAQAEKGKTKIVRQELDEFRARIAQMEADEKQDKISRKMQQLIEKQERKKNKPDKATTNQPVVIAKKEEPIKVGSRVRMKGQRTTGEVLEINNKNATVLFGSIKTTTKLNRLENSDSIETPQASTTYISSDTNENIREKKLNFKQDIDLRGMRGDEALQAVTYFIDDAILVGVNRVSILHGTGTGALRSLIRDYLSGINAVKSYRDEHVQLGGSGITVVEF